MGHHVFLAFISKLLELIPPGTLAALEVTPENSLCIELSCNNHAILTQLTNLQLFTE